MTREYDTGMEGENDAGITGEKCRADERSNSADERRVTLLLVSFGALGRDLGMPLPTAHARDLRRLEQSRLAKRLIGRERLGRLAVGNVDDEDAAKTRLAVLGQQSAAEHDLVFVPLEVGEVRLARRLADRQRVGPVFVVQDVEH